MKPIYEIIKPALIEAADDCMITLQKENAEYRLCMENILIT